MVVAAAVIVTMIATVITPSFDARASTLLTVSGSATATSTAGASIIAGDVFDWSVTFDLDTDSTSSTPSYGNTFNDSVTAFSLSRRAGNAGTWDPAGVTWPITPAYNVHANANGDSFGLQLLPTGAPAIDGVAFRDVGLTFNMSGILDAVWVSGVTDLQAWLGTSTPDFSLSTMYFELRDTSYNSPTFTVSVTPSTTAPAAPAVPRVPGRVPPWPEAVVSADGSVVVSWDVPFQDGAGPITGYRVVSSPSGGSCVTSPFDAELLSCVVAGLEPDVDYLFEVFASNGVGEGAGRMTQQSVRLLPEVPATTVPDTTVESVPESVSAVVGQQPLPVTGSDEDLAMWSLLFLAFGAFMVLRVRVSR